MIRALVSAANDPGELRRHITRVLAIHPRISEAAKGLLQDVSDQNNTTIFITAKQTLFPVAEASFIGVVASFPGYQPLLESCTPRIQVDICVHGECDLLFYENEYSTDDIVILQPVYWPPHVGKEIGNELGRVLQIINPPRGAAPGRIRLWTIPDLTGRDVVREQCQLK